jgi:hypothetical protein
MFPFQMNRRKTNMQPKNEMDKCTIFSIYPREIVELKPTIQPGKFVIKPGSYDNPSRLVVGGSSWWKELDDEQPLLEIPVFSNQIAESVIQDWANGLIACNMTTAMPGLFYVQGELSLVNLVNDKKYLLDTAKTKQIKWYETLLLLADGLWAASNGHPLSISEDMKLAASELKVTGKPWMANHVAFKQVACHACGSLKNPDYPVCAVCKAITDPEKAKKLGIQFSTTS